MRRLAAAPHHLGSPAGREERRVDPGEVPGVGPRRAHRDVRRALPDAEGAPRRARRARDVPRVARRDGPQGRPDLGPDGASSCRPTTPTPSTATSPRRSSTSTTACPDDYERLERLGVDVQGQDRDRPLRRRLARHQAEGRGREGRASAASSTPTRRTTASSRARSTRRAPSGPEQGVQRGSVADMPIYSGDPLTPGIGATKDARRLDRKDAATITKIPVLPISYGDAKPLLAALEGPVAPEGWRGALPITYRVGPGPGEGPPQARLRLEARSRARRRREESRAASGPTSGSSAATTTTPGSTAPRIRSRGLVGDARGGARLRGDAREGLAAQAHDRPLRLGRRGAGAARLDRVGRDHADELRPKAVAYINTDGNGRGFLLVGGSHSLEAARHRRRRGDRGPRKEDDRARARTNLRKISRRGEARGPAEGPRARRYLELEALGSGSDYTPFLQHIGLASLNVGFDGESDGGIYHSIYDDFTLVHALRGHRLRLRARARADRAACMTLRLANADVLPFDFTGSSEAVAALRQGGRGARRHEAPGDRGDEPSASRRTCRGPSPTRRSPSSPRSRASCRRTSTSRRCRTPRTR